MKLMIASDIHGSAVCCARLLQAFEREKADRLLLLGDALYHGPRNGLPADYDPVRTSDLLNSLKDRILYVRGNCDSDVDQLMLAFPILPENALVYAEGVTLFATHGHVWNLKNPPPLRRGEVLIHGHTHVPCWIPFGENNLCLNPGSVTFPKEDSQRSYMTLENGLFEWKTLDGSVYHSLPHRTDEEGTL